MEVKSVSIKAPDKGDVIWAKRSLFYFHCGIYEDDNSVYHFASIDGSKSKEDAIIHSSTLADFAKGSSVSVKKFPSKKCLPVEETIKRAREHLGKSGYNLFSNNCDHFATWCKTGEKRSLQVEFAITTVGVACALILINPVKRMRNWKKERESAV